MTTITLSDGDLGNETIRARCNLSEASAPVESGLRDRQRLAGHAVPVRPDTRHTTSGLIEIGNSWPPAAVEVSADEFDCDVTEDA